MLRLALALILAASAARAAPQPDALTMLCATNPSYSPAVMRSVLDAQLQRDHDPALDAETPDQMASEAAQLGVKDCVTDLSRHPAIVQALAGLSPMDAQVGWDAYNTTCDDRPQSKGECIKAEVGSAQALRRMMHTDQPPGAKALIQACQLVLKSDLAMVEWRTCVDAGLAVHAPPDRAKQCKTSVTWHVAKTGAEAGAAIAACLKG